MTSIPVSKPVALKTASVTFTLQGEGNSPQDFSDHVNQIQLDPSKSSGTPFTSVSGKVINASSVSSWAATLGLVQDFDTTGFLRFLLDNDGTKATMKATFETGTNPLECVVTLSAASIGGTADGSNLTSSVTLPVDGKPEFKAA